MTIERTPIDPDAALAAVIDALGGSSRAGQQQMAREVAETIARGSHLLVQAGTGTGKSFAYLVPALQHAVERRERVVISTATLALQRQIVATDAPRVADVIADQHGARPRVALLKGWQNYLCRYKVAGGYPTEEEGLFAVSAARYGADGADGGYRSALASEVLRLRAWEEETDTGDRDDLDPGVSDRAWAQVSVSKLECLGSSCPMIRECFPQAAREAAADADVVVTNHTMLGIAAAGNQGLLPEHSVLVVDEAHDLADRATTAGTLELSVGLVVRTAKALKRAGLSGTELERAADALGAALEPTPEGRLTDGLPPALTDVVVLLQHAAREAVSAAEEGRANGDTPGWVDFDEGEGAVEGGAAQGANVAARAAAVSLFETCERIVSDSVADGSDVLWCSRPQVDGKELNPRLYIAPLDVAGMLARGLWAQRSAILTSATLELGGGFDAMARQVGFPLGVEPWRGVDVGSPFDHGAQAILYVARHLPRVGREGISREALDEIVDLVRAAGGRTLGLFSSWRAAQAAAEHLREHIDTPVLCQGDDQLPLLVRDFAQDQATSLMGTLSLWQGVDIPGPSLSLVIIDRIPFPRPDDPIMSARARAAEAAGGNGFMEVSATHGALLLAQGSGRLLRRSTDRGVVAILDQRLVTARYGSFLMSSLAPMWRTTDKEVTIGALGRLAAAADESAV